jgi:hypothetical protein
MGLLGFTNRLLVYYSRNGLVATLRRVKLATRRGLFANRKVVFYCDLTRLAGDLLQLPQSLTVDRLTGYSQLGSDDLAELTSFWNPKQAHRDIKERFDRGASLWLIRSGNKLAGYGWTVLGDTIAPYFFPMGENDVQLFDFYSFPKFRGRAIHLLLIAYILQAMAGEGRTRAFGDTAEWNDAQLASFKMTPFRRLGYARFITVFGHSFVAWSGDPAAPSLEGAGKQAGKIPATSAVPHAPSH